MELSASASHRGLGQSPAVPMGAVEAGVSQTRFSCEIWTLSTDSVSLLLNGETRMDAHLLPS